MSAEAERTAEIIRSMRTGGAGGVYLNAADYPQLRPERVRAIKLRADRGLLTTQDRANALSMGRRERAVRVEKGGVFGFSGRVAWTGYSGTGIRDDGTTGTIEFFEPPQDSGRRQIEADIDRRGGSLFSAEVLADGWTMENDARRSAYVRAIDDALDQLRDNAAAQIRVSQQTDDYEASTPEGKRAANAARETALRRAAVRSAKIAERIADSDGLAGQRLAARLAFISRSNGLTGAYAEAIDRGEDAADAAAALVPEVPEVQTDDTDELSAIDRLYPLEAPDYYLQTFSALPEPWGALYLGFTGSADVPLASPDYYLQTLPTLPKPWFNLYIQAIQE